MCWTGFLLSSNN